jgi:hypothetical protein
MSSADNGPAPPESPQPPPAAKEAAEPVIGKPTAPPQALVVAISDRMAARVRSARRRQFARNTASLFACGVAAVVIAHLAELVLGAGRGVAVAEILVFGSLLALGALVRRRPLELGAGVLARDRKGRFSAAASIQGGLLLVSSAFREAVEGLLHGTGLIRTDPASELASWVVLALSPPHGPGPGTWVSLGGVGAAGLFSLPEDLRVALCALRAAGLVEVDRGRYPPRVRLAEGAQPSSAELLGSG